MIGEETRARIERTIQDCQFCQGSGQVAYRIYDDSFMCQHGSLNCVCHRGWRPCPVCGDLRLLLAEIHSLTLDVNYYRPYREMAWSVQQAAFPERHWGLEKAPDLERLLMARLSEKEPAEQSEGQSTELQS